MKTTTKLYQGFKKAIFGVCFIGDNLNRSHRADIVTAKFLYSPTTKALSLIFNFSSDCKTTS